MAHVLLAHHGIEDYPGFLALEKDRPACRKTVLDNGIRIITESMTGVRSISMGVLIDAGPRDESPQQNGLAHLVEHAIFQGTSNRDAIQIARIMDAAGGQMGAFTTRDYTCFTATVLDDYRTYAIDLLGDMLLNSIFPPRNLGNEKRAIISEIEFSRDIPQERSGSALKKATWPHHPLGRPIAGTPETVEPLTRKDVIYFVHEHYMPDRLIIAAAGNLEHSDFVAQAQDAFWSMLGENGRSIDEPPEHHGGVIIEDMAVSQVYFSIGLPAFPYADADRYGLHVLNNVLGGGTSSRLFRRIREEKGLVYHISSEYHAYRDVGMLVIKGSTAPDSFLTVLKLILEELCKLITGAEPADEEELWKAKMQLRGQHLIGSENTHTRMSRLATQELYFGRHIATGEILAQIDTVDPRIVERLAADKLVESLHKITVAAVGPETMKNCNTSSVERLLASL